MEPDEFANKIAEFGQVPNTTGLRKLHYAPIS